MYSGGGATGEFEKSLLSEPDQNSAMSMCGPRDTDNHLQALTLRDLRKTSDLSSSHTVLSNTLS